MVGELQLRSINNAVLNEAREVLEVALSGQMGGLQVSNVDLPMKTLSLLWAACS
jgi:hypothetical protein